MLTSCVEVSDEADKTLVNSVSDVNVIEVSDFIEKWDGTSITETKAKSNNCLYLGSNSAETDARWLDFCSKVDCGEKCEIIVCNSDRVIKVENVLNKKTDEFELHVKIKSSVDGVISDEERVITPAKICLVNIGGIAQYYVSDILLYTEKFTATDIDSDGEKENFVETPYESNCYLVSADANITFPYQKTFSSYDDFKKYYDKYDAELNLSEFGKAMKAYDKDGGFNTHVVFLYADMAGSEDVRYEFLHTVKVDNELYIYMKKSIPREKNSSIAKWQFTVTVSGEYLDEVKPDCINWVVYNDAEM